jgi:hypothetical protein
MPYIDASSCSHLATIGSQETCIRYALRSTPMARNGPNGANHVLVTADNIGPVLAIVTWFLLTMMIVAIFFRMVIKRFVRRRLTSDDYPVCAALVRLPGKYLSVLCCGNLMSALQLFGIAQSIAISISIKDGLGKRKASLNPASLTNIEKVGLDERHV